MNTLKQKLFDRLKGFDFKQEDMEEIMFAFDVACCAHYGQKRDTGEDYITHPVEGCIIMAQEFDIRIPFLHVAFLLHDVGEDAVLFGNRHSQPYEEFKSTCVKRVTRIFGERAAQLVVALTKPAVDGMLFKDKKSMMAFYLEQLSAGYHGILLKMIDRLHNLRSLDPENKKKIVRQINETEGSLIPVFKKGIADAAQVKDPIRFSMEQILQSIEDQLGKLKEGL